MRNPLKLLLLCLVPAALAATDLSGAWTGAAGSPIYLILKQDGNHVSGSGGPSAAEQILRFDDGTLAGDRLTFRAGPFQFDLKVEADRMTGEVRSEGGGPAKAFLRRANPGGKRPAGTPLPAFEVASVKPAPPPPLSGLNSSMRLDPGRLTCTNVTLKKLMVRAYDVKDYQVVGPDWMTTALYTIEARLPPDTAMEDLLLMIQGLLAERFQLAFHRETREMPVYELVVGKSGARLKPVEFGRGSTSMTPGKLTAQAVPLRNFLEQLSRMLDRPVLDGTGLSGLFDFTLEWAPEGKSGEAAADLPSGPSLFTAIQEQLGLKLEARKAPVELLVVDRAEKTPAGN